MSFSWANVLLCGIYGVEDFMKGDADDGHHCIIDEIIIKVIVVFKDDTVSGDGVKEKIKDNLLLSLNGLGGGIKGFRNSDKGHALFIVSYY